MISIDEVRSHPEQWNDTSYLRFDGKIEYREKKEYGDRHVIFENNAFCGDVHVDEFNATDFPLGTINHATNYVEEKTGIPKEVVTLGGIALALFAGYKAVKWADKNL